MALKIVEVNPSIRENVDANGGYCPCAIWQNPDTKCMCKEFRDQTEPGLCHCGRFEKVVAIDLTDKQILALKAVAYGCNKNKRLVGASYISDIHSTKTQDISFYEALTIVYKILDELEGNPNGK